MNGGGPCLTCGQYGTHTFVVLGGPQGYLCEACKDAPVILGGVTYGETQRRHDQHHWTLFDDHGVKEICRECGLVADHVHRWHAQDAVLDIRNLWRVTLMCTVEGCGEILINYRDRYGNEVTE